MKTKNIFKDREQTSIKGFREWLDIQKNLGNLEFERCNTGATERTYTLRRGRDKGKKKKYFYQYGSPGTADFKVFLHGARCIFVEFKTKKGKQEDSQIEFQKRIVRLGFVYGILNNAGDAIDLIERLMEL